jgi:hypothetical protein
MPIKQLISAAIADRGTAMNADQRSLMEDCFESSFRDVRLHFSAASQVANDALGSLAFTVGNHVCFRPGFDGSLAAVFTYLLAHELSHVVQKRRARTPAGHLQSIPTEAQLEQEADTIAAGVLQGMRATRVTPDPSSLPRLYGPAGHYYTAFYTALAVGFNYEIAKKIAFYTQLPDLVEELDATAAGFSWWETGYLGIYLGSPELYLSKVVPGKSTEEFWQHFVDGRIDRMVAMWQIQAGLHALTGGDGEVETRFRTKILNQSEPGTLKFGLAVHAFGDSFAHRDFHTSTTMYGPPFGHLAEWANHAIRLDPERDPHDPDKITLRKTLYSRYGSELYAIMARKSPVAPPVNIKEYQSDLADVSDHETEIGQKNVLTARMRSICDRTMGGAPSAKSFTNFYEPPLPPHDDAVPWKQFRTSRPDLDPGLKDQAIEFAAEWCGSASPFHISVTASWKDLKGNLIDSFESIPNAFVNAMGLSLTPMQWCRQLYGESPYR